MAEPARSQPPTMAEVARLAGVSKPTVSRVLRGTAPVAESTRRSVEAAIRELGYQVNSLAQAFAQGRMSNVSVVLPFMTHPAAVDRGRGIMWGLRDSGWPVSLFSVDRLADRDTHLRAMASSHRPLGAVIISLSPTDDDVTRLTEADVPIVLIDRFVDGVPSVNVDDVDSGRVATRHLVELGHRRIAFVGDAEDEEFEFIASPRRRQGFHEVLDEAGIAVPVAYDRLGSRGRGAAAVRTAELLALDEPPTAIFSVTDREALGVIDAVRAQGLRVPEDVSVISCDDVEMSADLGLTTVSIRHHDVGVEAAQMLMRLIDDRSAQPQQVVLDVELKIRATTGPPAA